MENGKPVATTGTVTMVKTVPDTPLSPEEHSVYRTVVGKLLWLALIRGDVACATMELRRDVSLRRLDTRMGVLILRPSYQLSDPL